MEIIKGKNALITGASGGIGSAIAIAFARRGINLALHYSSTEPNALLETISQIDPKIRVSLHKADLSETDQCIRLCEDVLTKFGGQLDILVSNAGYGKRMTDIWEIPIEEFDKMISINLRPTFILCKLLVPQMRDRGWGRIIIVSSIAASKGGQTSMMKNMSAHLAQYGITVNDVSPAMIEETGMIPSDEAVGGIKHKIPVGRLGKTFEVSNVVNMFLDTGYMTGQSVLLSGGLK